MDKTATELVFVVGERFLNALDSRHYINYKQFLETTQGTNPAHSHDTLFTPGQGLSEEERQSVHSLISEAAPHLQKKQYRRTLLKSQLHKNYQENVLISELDELSPNEYSSELVIHNDNELIQDHLSGSHIPGMIFVEATRQLSIAAWSCYENQHPHTTALLIKDIHCEYYQFAFPFQTDIHTTILKEGANTYEMDIFFTQNNEQIAHTFGHFSTIESKSIQKIEKRQMRTAIRDKTTNIVQNNQKTYIRSV